MSVFTSSLPDDLLKSLKEKSVEMSVPKNKIIERALRIYIEQLERAAYIKSYKQASMDKDVIEIAEEGMIEYLEQINTGEGD